MQVSIIIPTYNRVKDLEETLDSIIIQTKLPGEVIIVDNGNNIETENLVKRRKEDFKKRNVILKYIRSKENSLTVAKNIGVKYSTGDIIFFLDDDVILANEYIREILKVYDEKPAALGVQGYITNREIYKDIFSDIFFFGHSEPNKNRLLPSMMNVHAGPLNKVINCEWMCGGVSSYKRGIFEKYKFDENLKRVSSGEDEDFSNRIFKEYPNALYQTPYAKLTHKISPAGRLPRKESVHMREVYSSYLFYKDIDQTLKNKLIFLWNKAGILVWDTISLILKPSKSKLLKLRYTINAYILCIRHMNEIKKGNLDFFNEWLR